MPTIKRDYHHGSGKHSVQYPSTVSQEQYDRLEEFRKKVSERKGIPISRGQFIMWMFYRTFTTFEDCVAIDDFCDKQISDIADAVDKLNEVMRNAGFFKNTCLIFEDGEDNEEKDN
jgi:hypothetical protein